MSNARMPMGEPTIWLWDHLADADRYERCPNILRRTSVLILSRFRACFFLNLFIIIAYFFSAEDVGLTYSMPFKHTMFLQFDLYQLSVSVHLRNDGGMPLRASHRLHGKAHE